MAAQRWVVVGGGILGAAVARRLLQVDPGADVVLLEKEDRLAAHQSGHNSGVVHAGLYYEPGSLKAVLCRRGTSLLHQFCAEHDVPVRALGKVVVALDEGELPRLHAIAERARANGVPGLRPLDRAGLADVEPEVAGVAALHSPTTAVVDYAAVTRALAADAVRRGAVVRTGAEVTAVRTHGDEVVVTTRQDRRVSEHTAGHTAGHTAEHTADRVVVCAGLQADRVARLAGDDADPVVVPFRGEYAALRPERRGLVRGLVYPVPDPRYPFLGVHLTPRVDGEVLVGPNAVLALAREGYAWHDVSGSDLREVLSSRGFRRFAAQHWRTGVTEVRGSLSRRAFVAAAQRYLPALTVDDVVPGPAGVRAQALDRDGRLVDDFRLHRVGRVLAVRNAPSPAATSSLAIAEHVVAEAAA